MAVDLMKQSWVSILKGYLHFAMQ